MVFIEILKLTVHSLVVVWWYIRKVKVFYPVRTSHLWAPAIQN